MFIVLRNTMNMLEFFSASEAAKLAGFSGPLMLNYLERSGTFTAEIERRKHHGKRRRYTFRDLVVLRAINRLLQLGARPKRIELAINTFTGIVPELESPDALLAFCRRSSTFVVTEKQVLFCEGPDAIYDLAAGGQLAFAFMVSTRNTMEPVAQAVVEFAAAVEKRQSTHVRAAMLDKILDRHKLGANRS